MQDFSDRYSYETPIPSKKRKQGVGIGLAIVGGFFLLCFACCFGFFLFVGLAGPETSVYKGSGVPDSYVKIAREVGGLEMDESIEYFYSDGLVDIKEGFYYASDRKVAVYVGDETPPLSVIPYDEIVSIDFDRDTTFLNDSHITIVTKSELFVIFPVSSEMDRDIEFHRFIVARSPVN